MANHSCPVCSSTDVRTATNRRPWDLALALILPMQPMTCQACHHRFYARSPKIGSAYRVITWLALGLIVAWTVFLNVRYWELDREVARILKLQISGFNTAANSPETIVDQIAGNKLVDESRMEIKELLASLTQARDELGEVRKSFLDADKANGELLQARADMEIEIAKLGVRNAELEEEIVNLKTANIGTQSTLSGGGQDQPAPGEALESIKSEKANLERELAQATAALAENAAQLSKSEQDLAALKQTLSETQPALTRELESATSENAKLERALADVSANYEQANATLTQNAAQLSRVEAELDALKRTLSEQTPALARLAATESALAASEQDLAALHSDNLELKEELKVMGGKNARIEAEFTRTVAELAAASQRLIELEQTVTTQESVAGGIEQEIGRLKAANDDLQRQLVSALAARDEAGTALSKTNQHLRDSERLVSELNLGKESLNRDLGALTSANADLTRSLAATVDEKEKMSARLTDLTNQLAATTRKVTALEQTSAGKESDLTDRQQILAAVTAENLELTEQLRHVTAQKAQIEQWLIEKTTALAEVTAQPRVEIVAAAPDVPAPDAGEAAEQKIIDMLEQWRSDWSGKKVDSYLSHYAGNFQPADGLSQTAWRLQRAQRLSQPQFINVSVEGLRLLPVSADRFQAQFTQRYESDTYGDTVGKILELVREGDAWKIISERTTTG